jgi:hypothetical protein
MKDEFMNYESGMGPERESRLRVRPIYCLTPSLTGIAVPEGSAVYAAYSGFGGFTRNSTVRTF